MIVLQHGDRCRNEHPKCSLCVPGRTERMIEMNFFLIFKTCFGVVICCDRQHDW